MKQIVLAVIAAVFLVSCQNILDNEGQKNLELNEQAIQNYITSKKLTMEKSPSGSGLYYTYLKSNPSGTKPKIGDEVAIHYTLFTLQDVKFDSTERVANKPLTYIYGVNSLIAGMDEAMSIMRTGDRMLLLMNHMLAFGSQSDNILSAYSAVGADLELMSIRTEDQRIDDYITSKQLTVTELSSTGLRFIRTATTTENKVAAGEVVRVKYTGKLLNDKQFDSGEIQVRVGGGGVIKGFDEGVSKMRYNEKATLIFPSSLGYGTQGSGTTIMPYAPLVFEVEVLK
ncbi:FKBP-type peptidyl-prolyl cis-trans isomerase [Runella zeae]|jgi:FKBP-type peptidyl-prolyl cis-trans isomerase|uniref:FKBP-type peptidyl-prolyl cis-trans isomerase n=1 Tax=Runella zeae TaxID=94255 RepID=UPI000401A521|nr:FKBP-type peptidyl-prolyl cis-trans isomerase [Runella zeae]